jgi:hypothetical protein
VSGFLLKANTFEIGSKKSFTEKWIKIENASGGGAKN